MSDHIVTAFFAQQSDAERARDQLRQFGYHDGQIKITDQQAGPEPEAKHGLLDGLKGLLGRRDSSHVYTFGARGDRWLLTVEANEARTEEALRILEAMSSIDAAPPATAALSADGAATSG